MARWLAVQIVGSQHEGVARAVARLGRRFFYPRWRRPRGRTGQFDHGALYPGYGFVLSPLLWYDVLHSTSAVLGIVARSSDLEPLRSLSLDAHVEDLESRVDSLGFVPAPSQGRRSRFLGGDRVYIHHPLIEGFGTYVRVRGQDRAEVRPDDGIATVTVGEDALEEA